MKTNKQTRKKNSNKKKNGKNHIDSITGIKLWARLEMKSIFGTYN